MGLDHSFERDPRHHRSHLSQEHIIPCLQDTRVRMKNTGRKLPAEGRNYAGTSINNENPAPPSTHREKVTLLRGSPISADQDCKDRNESPFCARPSLDIQSIICSQVTDAGREFLLFSRTPIQMTVDSEKLLRTAAAVAVASPPSCDPARPAPSGTGPDTAFRDRIISCSACHNRSRESLNN